jgi:hypothetical protein
MRRKLMLVSHVLTASNSNSLLFLSSPEVVVIGSSFISMELVVVISKCELASIDIIGLEEFPFQAVLGKKIGASLKKALFFPIE